MDRFLPYNWRVVLMPGQAMPHGLHRLDTGPTGLTPNGPCSDWHDRPVPRPKHGPLWASCRHGRLPSCMWKMWCACHTWRPSMNYLINWTLQNPAAFSSTDMGTKLYKFSFSISCLTCYCAPPIKHAVSLWLTAYLAICNLVGIDFVAQVVS
jgi:hypothetical protein